MHRHRTKFGPWLRRKLDSKLSQNLCVRLGRWLKPSGSYIPMPTHLSCLNIRCLLLEIMVTQCPKDCATLAILRALDAQCHNRRHLVHSLQEIVAFCLLIEEGLLTILCLLQTFCCQICSQSDWGMIGLQSLRCVREVACRNL